MLNGFPTAPEFFQKKARLYPVRYNKPCETDAILIPTISFASQVLSDSNFSQISSFDGPCRVPHAFLSRRPDMIRPIDNDVLYRPRMEMVLASSSLDD